MLRPALFIALFLACFSGFAQTDSEKLEELQRSLDKIQVGIGNELDVEDRQIHEYIKDLEAVKLERDSLRVLLSILRAEILLEQGKALECETSRLKIEARIKKIDPAGELETVMSKRKAVADKTTQAHQASAGMQKASSVITNSVSCSVEPTVTAAVSCKSIENKAPVDISGTFERGIGKVYCYSRISLERGDTCTVIHKWFKDGKDIAVVPLQVRGPQWRTKSSKLMNNSSSGNWRVEIYSESGSLLDTVSFTIGN